MRLSPLFAAGLLTTLAAPLAAVEGTGQDVGGPVPSIATTDAAAPGTAFAQYHTSSEPNAGPAVWLNAELRGQNRVRLHLVGAQDRADSLSLGGTIHFGDRTDTTLARLPRYVDHVYPGEGTYGVVLQVEDSLGPDATVSLELSLESGVEVPLPVVEYERGYTPKSLDR